MVGIEEAAYAASHGSEFWVEGVLGLKASGGDQYALLDQLGRARQQLADVGVTVEVKRQGIAFHYRQAPDETIARSRIESLIRSVPAAGSLRRIEGRKVIELRPDIDASKGTATLELAGRLGVEGIVCIGDDRTDVDMFDAVHALGKRGLKGCAIAVMSPEVHPEVPAAADYSVEGVSGVEWLLGEIVEAITRTGA
jgi:trehalose 6-phosphate phosphatase